MLALFRLPIAVTIIGIAAAGLIGGPQVAGIVAILAILEVSLSFDNAVVNATVLQRMNPYWQRIFLTVGILIAVFGMRLLFPLIVVTIAGHISPITALNLALHHPHQYAVKLTQAHPAIGAFGGIFLLMIFLNFLFEDQEIKWLAPIERQLAKIGKLDQASVIIALLFLIVAATTFARKDDIQVLEGVPRILAALPQKYWTVVTSATEKLARARLGYAGLVVPEHFVTADTVTHGKPSPDPYLKGAELLGVKPQDCLVVEDSSAGAVAGHAAGCKVLATLFSHTVESLSAADWLVQSLEGVTVLALEDGVEVEFQPLFEKSN